MQKLENPALRACLQVQSNEVILLQLTQRRKHKCTSALVLTCTNIYLFAFSLGVVRDLCALVFADGGIQEGFAWLELDFRILL